MTASNTAPPAALYVTRPPTTRHGTRASSTLRRPHRAHAHTSQSFGGGGRRGARTSLGGGGGAYRGGAGAGATGARGRADGDAIRA